MSKLTYVSSSHGDWCAIYINKDLYTEGHSIPVHEWLEIITKEVFLETAQLEVDGFWLEYSGSFPQRLCDIPTEKLS